MTFDQAVQVIALTLGWSETHARYEVQRIIDRQRIVVDAEAVRASLQQLADDFSVDQAALHKEYREPVTTQILFPIPQTAASPVHENARHVPQQPSTYG